MTHLVKKCKEVLHTIGPGIITGASDDDPSGITTCSQAGAVAGLSLLWVAVFTTPLMIVIQEMCARIGLVTGRGLAGVLMRHKYPKALLFFVAVLVLIANTINIGADLQGMSQAASLLVPVPVWVLSIVFAVVISLFMVFSTYHVFARYMKWLTLALLCYVLTPLAIHIDWTNVFLHTIRPTIVLSKEYLTILVALFGTIISPYLFFWQAEMEIEDKKNKFKTVVKKWIVTKHELKLMRTDVTFGMILSNLTMWFIILTAGLTLHSKGIVISTAKDAALALRPLLGDFSYLLFTVGLIGTGLLAIPVLAGSSSYVISEMLGWNGSITKNFNKAKRFYVLIISSTIIGVVMNALGVDPIQALIYTAVLYGIVSPLLIGVILHIANNKTIMGKYVNTLLTNTLGVITLLVMTACSLLFFWFSLR